MSYSKCVNDTDCSKEHGGIHADDISEYWEEVASHGLGLPWKRWHIAFLVVSGIMSFVILICCCIKFRIPRTKQEIEADYVRRKILRKFKERLKAIQNTELDEMDLKKALDKIRSEFKSDSESIAQSEAGFSAATLSSAGAAGAQHGSTYRRASQIQIDISLEELRAHTLGMKARFILALNRLFGRSKVSHSDKVALTLDINAEGDTQLNVSESAVKANVKKDTEVKKVGKADEKKKEIPLKGDKAAKPDSTKGKDEKQKKTKSGKSDPEQPGSSGVAPGPSKTGKTPSTPQVTVQIENEKPKKPKAKGDNKGKVKEEASKDTTEKAAKKPEKSKPEKGKPEKSKLPPADKEEKGKQKADKEKEDKEKQKLEKDKQKEEKEKQKAEKEKQKLDKEKEKAAKAKEKAELAQKKKLEEQKKKEEKIKSKSDKSKDVKGKEDNKGP